MQNEASSSTTATTPPVDRNQASVQLLAQLVDTLRPRRRRALQEQLASNIQRIIDQLAQDEAYRHLVKQALMTLFTERRAILLFANTGIYPETNMLSEAVRRISHRLLPQAEDTNQLKDVFRAIFRRRDIHWLELVSADDWARLIQALHFDADDSAGLSNLFGNLLEAMRVVCHRIAASGLEPEMLQLNPQLELHESPFLSQCEEALSLVAHIEQARHQGEIPQEDGQHFLVLIDQCETAIAQIKRRAKQQGASFHLTFFLRRLQQYLDRAKKLSVIAIGLSQQQPQSTTTHIADMLRELILAEQRSNDLALYLRQNMELMALRVSENAGRAGEHYISRTREEYTALLRSALGGGFVIALMAANKIWLGTLGLAPLLEVIAFSLNYALGFVLIHILNFSVATKQPAMTANAIAAAIDETSGKERDMEKLTQLISSTIRSQVAAIFGNISLAIPTAMVFGYLLYLVSGEHFVSPDKATQLLSEIDPIASGSIFFAAVAGVCLFLAGLISGYFDNVCMYHKIPQRLLQLRWPTRLFGTHRWQTVVAYIEDHLGALAGNFVFGILLGSAAGLGALLGLPIDIRHIAFASANWGYAMTGLEFTAEWSLAILAALGIFAIGLTNLLVSFYLALWVGLSARGVSFTQKRHLAWAVARRLLRKPQEFILPPPADTSR